MSDYVIQSGQPSTWPTYNTLPAAQKPPMPTVLTQDVMKGDVQPWEVEPAPKMVNERANNNIHPHIPGELNSHMVSVIMDMVDFARKNPDATEKSAANRPAPGIVITAADGHEIIIRKGH